MVWWYGVEGDGGLEYGRCPVPREIVCCGEVVDGKVVHGELVEHGCEGQCVGGIEMVDAVLEDETEDVLDLGAFPLCPMERFVCTSIVIIASH